MVINTVCATLWAIFMTNYGKMNSAKMGLTSLQQFFMLNYFIIIANYSIISSKWKGKFLRSPLTNTKQNVVHLP